MSFSLDAPFLSYSLDDAGLIQLEALSTAWDNVRDHSKTITTLEKMALGQNIVHRGKKLKWSLGDYPLETATLANTLAYDATTIDLTEKRYVENDLLYFYETDEYAVVRLGSFVSQISASVYRYNCTVIDTDSTTTFTTSSTGILSAPATIYDGEARKYLNAIGDTASNYIQRMRDTVGVGSFESAEYFYADHSIGDKARKGWRSFARKRNLALFTNVVAAGRPSSGDDYGISGGFDFYFNARGETYSESSGIRTLAADGYQGYNQVDSGTDVDYDNFLEWVEKIARYGSGDKVVSVNPTMYLKMKKAMRNEVVLNVADFREIAPNFGSAWNVPVVEMEFARLWFVVDRGLTNLGMTIKDDDDSTQAASTYWACAWDPAHTRMVTADVPEEGGAQECRMRTVEKKDNGSINKVEFDCAKALVIDDPRTGGFYGITNS